MSSWHSLLVEAAIHSGLLAADVAPSLLQQAQRHGYDVAEWLCVQGRFPRSALFRALASHLHFDFVDLRVIALDSLISRYPVSMLKSRRIIPLDQRDGYLQVACAHADSHLLPLLERTFGQPIRLLQADPDALQQLLLQLEPDNTVVSDSVMLLETLFIEAYTHRASDIHLESLPVGGRVRLRIDGYLQPLINRIDSTTLHALLSRLKVLAGLDIAEQRAPQDGGFRYRFQRYDLPTLELRLATLPTKHGERATLRILGQANTTLSLTDLGMFAHTLDNLRQRIRKPHGMLLITGPTGSGKSTSLYAALRELNSHTINIMTVEDPIESEIVGVSQTAINSSKVSFASVLRSFLRHDPDTIMLGEIRDGETADIALKAAMTGHFVFSTLHTNSACGAITRLIDLGVEPYLVASTLVGVVSQRLVRRLCPFCCQQQPATAEEQQTLALSSHVLLSQPQGCPRCMGTGFSGRVGLFETLWLNNSLTPHIQRHCTEQQLHAVAADALAEMWTDARLKVINGMTTLAEVARIVEFPANIAELIHE